MKTLFSILLAFFFGCAFHAVNSVPMFCLLSFDLCACGCLWSFSVSMSVFVAIFSLLLLLVLYWWYTERRTTIYVWICVSFSFGNIVWRTSHFLLHHLPQNFNHIVIVYSHSSPTDSTLYNGRETGREITNAYIWTKPTNEPKKREKKYQRW